VRTKRALGAAIAALADASQGRTLKSALAGALDEAKHAAKLGPKERRTAAQVARAVTRDLRRIDRALGLALERANERAKNLTPIDRALLRYLALRVSIEGEPAGHPLGELRLQERRRGEARDLDPRRIEAIARGLVRYDTLPPPEDPLRALAERRSVPDFLVRRIASEFGLERADRLLEALNAEPRLDLRANWLRSSGRGEVAERLLAEGVRTRPTPLAADGLVAEDRANLFGAAHRAGLFEVQDEGSQLLVELTQAAPGELAIDACAGAGGKTLALAAKVGSRGRVIASDAVAHRLDALGPRARRAGAERIIELRPSEPPAECVERADVVLVDAPCSGVGGLRREVDLRWRLGEASLDAQPSEQGRILAAASRFVRLGGRLVYATCSPFRAEDEEVAAAFVAAHGGFALEEELRLWPDRHDTGAFYGARFRRTR
jgi:16S rRNA (cytosine967-C5)-methyltransferase